MWLDILMYLGKAYNATTIVQSAGIWLYDVEAYAHYMFSRIIAAE